MALFRSPVPQILLSGNALYTSRDFFHDLRRRGDYSLWLDTRLKGQIAKWSVRAADRTVAPSQAFADEIERWTGVRALAIHHGFDRDLFFETPKPCLLNSRGNSNALAMNCACCLSATTTTIATSRP